MQDRRLLAQASRKQIRPRATLMKGKRSPRRRLADDCREPYPYGDGLCRVVYGWSLAFSTSFEGGGGKGLRTCRMSSQSLMRKKMSGYCGSAERKACKCFFAFGGILEEEVHRNALTQGVHDRQPTRGIGVGMGSGEDLLHHQRKKIVWDRQCRSAAWSQGRRGHARQEHGLVLKNRTSIQF